MKGRGRGLIKEYSERQKETMKVSVTMDPTAGMGFETGGSMCSIYCIVCRERVFN
jgi:hypothetical protein